MLARQIEERPVLGPSFDGRADPLPADPIDVKRGALAAFEELIGPTWLRRVEEHPIRELWARDDWLATLELVNMGILARKLRPLGSKEWWSTARQKLRSEIPGDIAGTAFEIVAGATLHSHGQTVRLAEPSQPGYDIALRANDGGVLRISCKALTISNEERKFRTFVDRLRVRVVPHIGPGVPLSVTMLLGVRDDASTFDLDKMTASVAECIRRRAEGQNGFFAHGWFIGVRPLPPQKGALFDPGESSHSFYAAQEHSRDEQERFSGKLHKAIDGLRRHCGNVTASCSNAVLIKLPYWIDDDEAEAYVRVALARNAAHVSAVILFRSHVLSAQSVEQFRERTERVLEEHDASVVDQVRHTEPGKGTNIGFMARIIENPGATIPLHVIAPKSVRFEVPYGQGIEERPQTYFVAGDETMPVKRSYLYWRAEYNYRTDTFGETAEFVLRPYVLAGATVRWRFFHNGEPIASSFNVPSCPHDELVLL